MFLKSTVSSQTLVCHYAQITVSRDKLIYKKAVHFLVMECWKFLGAKVAWHWNPPKKNSWLRTCLHVHLSLPLPLRQTLHFHLYLHLHVRPFSAENKTRPITAWIEWMLSYKSIYLNLQRHLYLLQQRLPVWMFSYVYMYISIKVKEFDGIHANRIYYEETNTLNIEF